MKTLLKFIGIAFGLFLALTFILYGFVESPNATQAQIDKEQAREQAKIDYQERKLEEEIAYDRAADWEYLHCQLNKDNGGDFYRKERSLETDDVYIKMNVSGFEEPVYSKSAIGESRFEAKTISVTLGYGGDYYMIDLAEYKKMRVTQWELRYDFPIRINGLSFDNFESCGVKSNAIQGVADLVEEYCQNLQRVSINREGLTLKADGKVRGNCKFVSKKEYDEPFKEWTEYKIKQKRLREEESERAYQERLDNRKF